MDRVQELFDGFVKDNFHRIILTFNLARLKLLDLFTSINLGKLLISFSKPIGIKDSNEVKACLLS